ncbi:phage regulatory CII family protein [Neorhizobium alkalisoli]|uniref:Uncharacterized protein n=1 Tax=Neorhizobium alkalisoli TaxID=528178 RepID=A0A561QS78_9HYPH|nr:phage regulatory CII family protein [Neorhizobium alkalisoli]TWF53243.1 hypothetical protein FHW37_104520 [Neorhizobium alkalisoli]
MRAIRSILAEDILSLKGITDACLKLGGGMTSFAKLTRVVVSQLSKYASTSEENFEQLIPVDIAVEADRRAGKPLIVEEMARQLGYRLELVDQPAAGRRKITDDDAMDLMKEAMDVIHALRTARADGKIDAADRKRITVEVRELQRELEELLTNLSEGCE